MCTVCFARVIATYSNRMKSSSVSPAGCISGISGAGSGAILVRGDLVHSASCAEIMYTAPN